MCIRDRFKKIVETININGYQAESARSVICHTLEECFAASDELGYPMVVRPSFTMGGAGSGTVSYTHLDVYKRQGPRLYQRL